MLTSNKKLFRIIVLIFLILAFYSVNSNAVVSPTKEFYVNDYANVLSKETEEYIINTNVDLNNKTKAQIVVVTVKSLDGKTIEEYATELFRKFGIGDKKLNNGVLLLCSTGDRMFRIEVGYGLEGALPDGKTGRIQDEYIIPYLKNNDYDKGIKNGFSAVIKEVSKEYNTTVEGIQSAEKTINLDRLLGGFFDITIVTCIISRVVKSKDGDKKSLSKIKVIYLIVIAIISYAILKSIILTIFIAIINLIMLSLKATSGGFYSGGSSGGGWSSGRRWMVFWRRRILGWRRFFWRRRKL